MSIDWSKAPAHATHWCPGNARIEAGWIYVPGGGEFYSCYADKGLEHIPGFPAWRALKLIPRPKEIASWTGEGLPPVGTVCDLKFEHWTDWERHEILCHGKTFMFVRELNSGLDREGSMSMDGIMFRQVRTPEQIAEEKRIAELNLMVGAIKDYPGGHHGVDHLAQLKIQEEACINLYDAGWRKQVVE